MYLNVCVCMCVGSRVDSSHCSTFKSCVKSMVRLFNWWIRNKLGVCVCVSSLLSVIVCLPSPPPPPPQQPPTHLCRSLTTTVNTLFGNSARAGGSGMGSGGATVLEQRFPLRIRPRVLGRESVKRIGVNTCLRDLPTPVPADWKGGVRPFLEHRVVGP